MTIIANARNDSRFMDNHFILSEVNASFLERNGINKTVKSFKNEVRQAKWDFRAKTGNELMKTVRYTKVYNINNFRKLAQEV